MNKSPSLARKKALELIHELSLPEFLKDEPLDVILHYILIRIRQQKQLIKEINSKLEDFRNEFN